MGNAVKDYKSKPPRIDGVSVINHAIRVKMGLGPMEFVLMDAFVWLKERKKLATNVSVYIRTGLVPGEQDMALEMLVMKGFVYPNAEADGSPSLSDKWASFFTSIKDEFPEFWVKDEKNCWPGSKTKALELYLNVRRKVSKEFLIEKRDKYFEFLDLVNKGGFDRSKMMATVFLGKQARYTEEWGDYVDELKAKIKKDEDAPMPVQPSTKTKAERMKKYENPDIKG